MHIASLHNTNIFRDRKRELKTAHAAILITGAWLFLSSLLFATDAVLFLSVLVSGLLVLGLTVIHLLFPQRQIFVWTLAGLGVWLMLLPLQVSSTAVSFELWNAMGMGGFLILLGAWTGRTTSLEGGNDNKEAGSFSSYV